MARVHKQGREIGHTTYVRSTSGLVAANCCNKAGIGSKEPVLITIIQAGPEGQ